eukprot:scaffold234_cov406-Prasinococcus_capsulatus_cf.AAC.15
MGLEGASPFRRPPTGCALRVGVPAEALAHRDVLCSSRALALGERAGRMGPVPRRSAVGQTSDLTGPISDPRSSTNDPTTRADRSAAGNLSVRGRAAADLPLALDTAHRPWWWAVSGGHGVTTHEDAVGLG